MAEEASGTAEPGSVCFLADEGTDEKALEPLGEALGRTVELRSAEQLRSGIAEALAGAGVVVVPWELASRSGLELVEALRQDPQTAELPVIMAWESPTRAMVRAALAAGASSFVLRPYDAEELKARLAELVAK